MRHCYIPLIVISQLFLLSVSAEQIRITVVSRNQFGSNVDNDFECHLSNPDADATVSLYRYVDTMYGILLCNFYGDCHSKFKDSEEEKKHKIKSCDKLVNAAYEVFTCVSTKQGKEWTSLTAIWMQTEALIFPSNGLYTQTVSIGDTDVSINMTIEHNGQFVNILWYKDREQIPHATKDKTFFFNGQVKSKDAGFYECLALLTDHDEGFATSGLNILIVRDCPTNRWGPPTCENVCKNCYNGGICNENTGSCVCPPGFMGTNCLEACGGNRYGYDCEKKCDNSEDRPDGCRGLLFCLIHPFGCRCNTGWKGLDCATPCDQLTYGANCLQLCTCSSHEYCNRFMGCRDLPRLNSAPFEVSKSNSSITIRWLAWDKSKDTGDPPIYGYIPYYKEKGATFWKHAPPISTESLEFTAIDLDPHSYYTFSVVVVREGGGEGPRSPSLDAVIFSEAPNIGPCNVKATVQGYHQDIVNVTWQVLHLENLNCNSGIEYFTIYITTTSNKQSFKVKNSEARWFTIESLEPGRFYTFQVSLSTGGGESPPSRATDQSTLWMPVLPRLTEAPFFLSISSDSVTIGWVEWNPTRDIGTPTVVAYIPYHKLSDCSDWINGSKVLFHMDYEYTFQGLTPGKFYDFSVAAVRDGFGGEGSKSPLSKTKVTEAARGHPYDTFVVLVIVSAITFIFWKRKIPKPSQLHQETSTSDLLETKDQGTTTSDSVDANIRTEEESQKDKQDG